MSFLCSSRVRKTYFVLGKRWVLCARECVLCPVSLWRACKTPRLQVPAPPQNPPRLQDTAPALRTPARPRAPTLRAPAPTPRDSARDSARQRLPRTYTARLRDTTPRDTACLLRATARPRACTLSPRARETQHTCTPRPREILRALRLHPAPRARHRAYRARDTAPALSRARYTPLRALISAEHPSRTYYVHLLCPNRSRSRTTFLRARETTTPNNDKRRGITPAPCATCA